MAALRFPLILLILLTGVSASSDFLCAYVGPLEYRGVLHYEYSEGDNPVVDLEFRFDDEIGECLLVMDAPEGWNLTQDSHGVELTGGQLQPGEAVSVDVSLRRYVPGGVRNLEAVARTSHGEESRMVGTLLITETSFLRFLGVAGGNLLLLVVITAMFGVVEVYLTLRSHAKPLD